MYRLLVDFVLKETLLVSSHLAKIVEAYLKKFKQKIQLHDSMVSAKIFKNFINLLFQLQCTQLDVLLTLYAFRLKFKVRVPVFEVLCLVSNITNAMKELDYLV